MIYKAPTSIKNQGAYGCVIVFKHSQKVVWHRKWVLHPVVAPIRDKKNAPKCPKKIDFFLGRGHSPLHRTPPRRRIAPPPSEILNTPLTGDSLTRKVSKPSSVKVLLTPVPYFPYPLCLLARPIKRDRSTPVGVVSELSDLVYLLYTTFAHTMTILPIINKLKCLSYQRPMAYRYGSAWAIKKWWYAFKPTKEVPVCHTSPYHLTSSPDFKPRKRVWW